MGYEGQTRERTWINIRSSTSKRPTWVEDNLNIEKRESRLNMNVFICRAGVSKKSRKTGS